MNVAIIPARIGSKRIFQKNIKKFYGKPIILHTLEKVIKSKLFDKIIVSSDSTKILKLSKKKNIYLHKRNIKYSNDKATTVSAINSCIRYFKFNLSDNVCCIYPCAALLEKKDLEKTLKILKKNSNKFVIPVLKYTHPIQRSFTMNKRAQIKLNFFKKSFTNTQKFRPSFFDAGQFYWAKTKTWLSSKSILEKSIGFNVPIWRAVDIDDIETWKHGEVLFKFSKSQK